MLWIEILKRASIAPLYRTIYFRKRHYARDIFCISPCKIIRSHESEKRFACGICNPAQDIRNPANDRNPESKFHWPRIRNPVPGIQNPQRGILNYKTSWIPLHAGKHNQCRVREKKPNAIRFNLLSFVNLRQ